ncbi:hypothetical protein ACFYW1_10930 [Streptomyces sp. NPDC002669]|uniref:hypothetical protein n=1 Tax=Streptomyces sp. NPDC002669 TaxID=3364658 RepID=UPI0036A74A17
MSCRSGMLAGMDAGGVVVQMIVVRWSVASRGGEGARLRSRVPKGFLLPEGLSGPLVHRVDCDERNGFVPRFRTFDGLRPLEGETPLRVAPEADGVRVFADRNRRTGAPPARRLGAGQWLRWRDTSSGRRRVGMTVVNVAVVGRPPSNLFLGAPTFSAESVESWIN